MDYVPFDFIIVLYSIIYVFLETRGISILQPIAPNKDRKAAIDFEINTFLVICGFLITLLVLAYQTPDLPNSEMIQQLLLAGTVFSFFSFLLHEITWCPLCTIAANCLRDITIFTLFYSLVIIANSNLMMIFALVVYCALLIGRLYLRNKCVFEKKVKS